MGTSKNSFWRAKCLGMQVAPIFPKKYWERSSFVEHCDEASLQASLPPEWIFRGSLMEAVKMLE